MKRLYLMGMLIGVHLCMHAEFPIVELSSIDLGQCSMIKSALEKRAWRRVYQCGTLFYKVWDPNFHRKQYFLDGVHSGFYDEQNTPLVALIYHQGVCRGYVTTIGVGASILCNALTILPIAMQQNQSYIDFYNDLLERTKRSRYVYFDLTVGNIILEDGKVKLIDLESLLPINLLTNRQFFNSKFYPQDYRSSISALKN